MYERREIPRHPKLLRLRRLRVCAKFGTALADKKAGGNAMKKQLASLLTERVALLKYSGLSFEDSAYGDAGLYAYLMKSNAEEIRHDEEREYEVETMIVDFEFEQEESKDFDIYMTIRYYWNDWNAIYTEVH